MTIYHLVDDAGFGGVNRMLDHLTRALGREGEKHELVRVKRGQLSPPRMEGASHIISHLSACWKNMPLMTALRARYAETPLIHVEHSYSERFVMARVDNRDRFDTLLSAAYALFDKVIAVSAQQGQWLARKYVSRSRLAVIEPCVALDDFFALPDRISGRKTVIGAMGRFDAQKGFDILIEGLRKSRRQDIEVHFYGQGSEERRLRKLAGNDPRIVFHGYAASPAAAMASCDVIAMPSRFEPYGLVALEAMAAGRPVIASGADGLAGHIENGAAGVGDNTPDGWTRLFDEFDINDFRRGAVSRRKRAKEAEQKFADRWLRLLGDLTEQPHQFQMAA
ncbi:glycosyltransferase family 4 protein [Martelella radicis]|uniref:Glycosyltransferase involved in cell wall biosynthesis n=1 Tax=Martelella radicis TaxID=1397476 RepID=A0A7W6KIP7_9HYPH|nr:glycosyltransferase family 4 protein [Martelella radicis]MBB4120635.1 glycosyltransferase involved in cell wall biosynthesis [Martelella radicis]